MQSIQSQSIFRFGTLAPQAFFFVRYCTIHNRTGFCIDVGLENKMSSRLNEYLSGIPCGTKLLLSVNLLMHAYIFLTSENLNYYAISPYTVIGKHEYYRILSSAFVHSNFMHIFMNMSSLLQLGPNVEIQFGTLYLLFLTAGAVLLSGVIYIAISW